LKAQRGRMKGGAAVEVGVAEALYHATSRGDRREPIVEDDVDRQAWVAVLGEACDRFG
jgi:hypothetical protein